MLQPLLNIKLNWLIIHDHCRLRIKLKFQNLLKRDSACDQFSKNNKSSCFENIDEENIFFFQQTSSQTDYWQEKHNAFRKSSVINRQFYRKQRENSLKRWRDLQIYENFS